LTTVQAVVTGSAAQVVDGLGRYVAAAARHLVLRLAALDLRSRHEQLELIAGPIPALRTPAVHPPDGEA
jgi:hypothetical protein